MRARKRYGERHSGPWKASCRFRACIGTVNLPASLRIVCTVFLIGAVVSPVEAQTNAAGGPWVYRLLEGSYLIDDCLPCARPTFMLPMRGSFTLILTEDNPLLARYEL